MWRSSNIVSSNRWSNSFRRGIPFLIIVVALSFPIPLRSTKERGAIFLTLDGRRGIALIKGELASLFSLPGAHYGNILVHEAVDRGASTLSCYDMGGKLPLFYGRYGFKEIFRSSWDEDLAPKNWDYAAWGRPDYVEMGR